MRGGRDHPIEKFKIDYAVELAALERRRQLLLLPALLERVLYFLAPALFIAFFINIILVIYSFMSDVGVFPKIIAGVFVLITLLISYSISRTQLRSLRDLLPGSNIQSTQMAVLGVGVHALMAFGLFKFYFEKQIASKDSFPVKAILIMMAVFVLIAILGLILRKVITPFKRDYTKLCTVHFLKTVDPDSLYQEKDFISRESFEAGRLYPSERIWRYTGKDQLRIRLGTNLVELCTLAVMEKKISNSGGKRKIEYKDLFRGLYFYAPLPEHKYSILIDHDNSGLKDKRIYQALADLTVPEMKLRAELSEGKPFNIYLGNEEVMPALPDEFWAKLERLAEQSGKDLRLSVQESGMHMAISGATLVSEYALFRPVTKLKEVKNALLLINAFDRIHDLFEEAIERA